MGAGAAPIAAGAAAAGGDTHTESTVVGDSDEAYRLLEAQLRAGDVVLLKSSRDSGLRWLGDRLVGLDHPSEARA